MIQKNLNLHQWLWKWHFIAGLISLPFMLILALSGVLYLFKDMYEAPNHQKTQEIKAEGSPISYQNQWEIAQKEAIKTPSQMVLPSSTNQATEFVSGRFSNKSSIFIDPYQAKAKGEIIVKQTFMYKIRKLHGELLLGSYGTKVVELIASWMVVLILTGLYVWFPLKRFSWKGVFTWRISGSKRLFYRDLHVVTGFWVSLLLLIILAGGFPWTDVFGANFKWLQQVTHTGYPDTWDGRRLQSTPKGEALSS